MKRIDLIDQLAQAVCYLLNYCENVWKTVRKYIEPHVVDFDGFGFFTEDDMER